MVRRLQSVRLFVALSALLLLTLPPLYAQRSIKRLGRGVLLKQYVQTMFNNPHIIHVLEVDLRNPSVRVEAALAGGTVFRPDPTQGREVVSATVQRLGALAGINADFFPWTGDPLGVHIENGELISEPSQRTAFGMTAEGAVLFGDILVQADVTPEGGEPVTLHGVNRAIQANECLLITPRWGEVYPAPNGSVVLALREMDGVPALGKTLQAVVDAAREAQTSVPVPANGALLVATGSFAERIRQWQSGTSLTFRFEVRSAGEQAVLVPESPREGRRLASRGRFQRQNAVEFWNQAVLAVGGGPWLVRNGVSTIDAPRQGFQNGFSDNRHPRTAVGVTGDGKLLLVTVDGRQPMAAGMTLDELARLMLQMGATDAINLDGGGSTTLAVRGGLVINSPSEGRQRPVANAVVVYAPRSAATVGAEVQIEPSEATVRSGESVRFTVRSLEKGEVLDPLNLIFGTTGGIGFVDQLGDFTGVKAGKGTVSAILPDDRVVHAEVTVVPGDPARLTKVQPATVPAGGERFDLVVRVVDRAGNPCPGVSVQMQAQGAFPEKDSAVTDTNGTARFAVAWDAGRPARDCVMTVLVAGVEGIAPLEIRRGAQ